MGTDQVSRVIVCLSGGVASAWCADWALRTYPRDKVLLYFNDTKWEHPDLYRFLRDLSEYWKHPITEDSDGRSPVEVFRDQKMLANNRAPFCSRVLKAERLQKYYQEGDTLVFGIGIEEIHRAHRLVAVYQNISVKRNVFCKLDFPILREKISKQDQFKWLASTGIALPELYKHGFEHNNCGGGCVRSGKAQWLKLLREYPETYAQREKVERDFRQSTGKDVSFLKGKLTLEKLRMIAESQTYFDFDSVDSELISGECMGTCDSEF